MVAANIQSRAAAQMQDSLRTLLLEAIYRWNLDIIDRINQVIVGEQDFGSSAMLHLLTRPLPAADEYFSHHGSFNLMHYVVDIRSSTAGVGEAGS